VIYHLTTDVHSTSTSEAKTWFHPTTIEVGFCYQVMRHRKLSLRTVLSLGSIPAPHLSLLILNLS
jgi:hypothetical protein